jgi:DNA-cytosine methyltransferase
MRYLSVCSGIEAASVAWDGLGFEPAGFSEIEPFPSAVLAHRFPAVKNYGDMTKFKEWDNVGSIGILVGGTPCQSFSVAGLRKGLDDPRGNLMLTYGAIADHFRPTWLVWENVPGVLSTNNGDDFKSFLDMLEELGYIIDVDILDAQFHGVPQRRRRVFVCGQKADDLLKKKTDSSCLTIIQCLQEISQKLLIVALCQSGNEHPNLDYQNRLKDGIARRMKLFRLVGESDNLKILQENLEGAFQRFLQEQNNSDASHGEYEKELTQEDRLTDFQTANQYTLTEQSLKKVLGEGLEVMKSCITLTGIKIITQSEIYLFSKLVLLTGKLTVLLNRSSPSFWSAVSSSLTALKEYTNYARQTTSELFGDMERVRDWNDFIRQAVRLQEFIGCIRVTNFKQTLPISESLRGHNPPSRKAGENIATNVDESPIVGSLCARTGRSMSVQDADQGHIISIQDIRGTEKAQNGKGWNDDGTAYTVDTLATQGVAVPMDQGGSVMSVENDITGTLRREPIIFPQVRRLTPTECERLQGFPDNWTQIPWRGKPAEDCPDGPRYKACGNSMAVPVMRWIGERIKKYSD